MLKSLTIIIPIYNEADSIISFLPKVIKHAKEKCYKLLLVNDGSMDNSLDVIKNIREKSNFNFKIVNHKLNKGYGAALKTGILNAYTDYVITIDADGQHVLSDVDNLFYKIEETNADLIVGSRKGLSSASVLRGIGKNIIRSVAKLLMRIPIYDINSGMKIYNTALVKKYLKLTPDTMAFSDVITLTFIHNRDLVIEEPISINERIAGESTIGVSTAFETVLEIINIIVLFNPMRVFLPISLFFLVFGLGWGSIFFFQGKGLSIGASTLLLISLIIFLLGIIAEQLSSLRKKQ